MLLYVALDLRVIFASFLALQLQTPQQIFNLFLVLSRDALVGLPFFFVDLLDGVNRVIAAAVRATFLDAHIAEVLLAAQAVIDELLVVHLAGWKRVDLVCLLDLVVLHDFVAVVVEAAAVAEQQLLSPTEEGSLLVIAVGAPIVARIVLPVLADCEIGLILELILFVRPEEEVVLEGVAIIDIIDQDRVQLGHIISMQSFPAQRYLADQKGKQFVLDGLRMNVDMSAVDNQILERNGLIPHPLHVVLPEISDIDHCVSSEDLHASDDTCSWMGSSANLYKLISFIEDLPVISCSWKSSWLHSTDAASSYLRIAIAV